ncbi:isoaspartyl peptidase/L-asparaginase family protein [Phnomibacter ginsenosidimutans]|uniref:Glycosylasparaginase n=1 Tax=Phnomibacter ginsenosidimutans TaxID=2676868 RepID=A0A6I6GKR9_9BACT|nr:N(4)-(beta-N-acetylglucosaminyl)-L-asparaginase [Phnomibacter ginsenosidimutans]QGW28228.1 glycosylasparaginase [Phnomibacter ginsenosidimutans]
MRRRKFVQLASLLPSGLLLNKANASPKSEELNTGKVSPVVISTWAPNVKANAVAWQVLMNGGNALDAVHQGVMVPEADPDDQSVGYGGLPDRDGRVTLDACIMDHQFNIGSVMYLEHIVHAITVARLVMEKTPHVQIVGEGALRLALEHGMKKENLLTEKSEKAWREWLKTAQYSPMTTVENLLERIKNNHDTIGMLALDQHGNLSGACTTSGMAYKMQGRIGDSPIIGAGLYVDNEVGGATATGVGEEVVRVCGSHSVVEYMRHGYSPADACKEAVKRLVKARGETLARKLQIGFIALNKKGETGCYSLNGDFTMAQRNQQGEKVIQSPALLPKS